MAYLDTCDRCLTADSPAVMPLQVVPTEPGSVIATYCCPNCGAVWICGWATQDEEAAA